MEKTDKKIEELRKAKCSYPNCKKKQFMTVMLPIGKVTERGQIVFPEETKEQSVQVGVPLCDYHFILAQHGILTVIEQEGKTMLSAPLNAIEICEVILEAKEFEKSMKKSIIKKNGKVQNTTN